MFLRRKLDNIDKRSESKQKGINSSTRRRAQKTPVFIVTVLCLAFAIGYYFFSFTASTLNVNTNDYHYYAPSITNNKNSTRGNYIRGQQKFNDTVTTTESEALEAEGEVGVEADDQTYTDVDPEIDCHNFDHGDTSPTPGVESIFNCNSEHGKCKWHYPAKFFDETCGVGKNFVDHIRTLKELHKNRTLWLSGPPIVLPWVSMTPRLDSNPSAHKFRQEPYPVHNISMTHVHKTGGTSLVIAFSSILSKGARGKRHTVYQPQRFPGPPSPGTRPSPERPMFDFGRSYDEASKFLNGAVKYKAEWGEFDHTLFAVIRDPAERFISAIGQATGAFGSSGNGVASQLVTACVKATSTETLSCFVDLIKNNGTLVEVHFTPMAFEISFATMWKDIPVAVFPFQEVPTLMNELGADPQSKKKDGQSGKHRKFDVLTNMTMADYDNSTLAKLCDIYWVDVLFMNQLGYESNCDWLLPSIK
jgi:hypothetical protein